VAWLEEEPLPELASEGELALLVAALWEVPWPWLEEVEPVEVEPSVVVVVLVVPDDWAVATTEPAPRATAVPSAPAAPRAITPFRAARVRRICSSRLVVMTQSIRRESVCFLGTSPAAPTHPEGG